MPKRVVPRLADLEANEVSDLFLSVQHVGKVLEDVYKARAMTVSLQVGYSEGGRVQSTHLDHVFLRTASLLDSRCHTCTFT